MMYTVKQLAEMLQVGVETINRFVDSGELDAIDVSLRRGKKRRLRIAEDSLRQFLERRRVHVPPPRSRRGRQAKPRRVIDYFALPNPEEGGRRRFKISDVAEYLGIKPDHVRQLIAYGHLRAINMGGNARGCRYRINEKDLLDFIKESKNEPKSERRARLRGPDFLDAFDESKPLPRDEKN